MMNRSLISKLNEIEQEFYQEFMRNKTNEEMIQAINTYKDDDIKISHKKYKTLNGVIFDIIDIEIVVNKIMYEIRLEYVGLHIYRVSVQDNSWLDLNN